jgi:hypothetical protein
MFLMTFHHASRLFSTLQMSGLTLALVLILGSELTAQNAGYAKGVLIYLAPGDTPQTASATLYRNYTKAFPHSHFDVGASSPMSVENGRILKMLDLSPLFADVSNNTEWQFLTRFSADIADISQQYPKSATICVSLTQVLEGFLNRYDNGEVRLHGVWENGQMFRDRMAAAEQEAMNQAAMSRKKQEEDQAKYNNLNGAYTPSVTALLQTMYDDYREKVSQLLESAKTDGFRLGPVDPGLLERSKSIPQPLGTNLAGIYAGDSVNSPVVIWSAKDNNLVSVMVGVSIVMNPETNQLGNERELTQLKNFLDRYYTDLAGYLPVFLAATKIERVLGKKILPKRYINSNVTMDVIIHPPSTFGNGEVKQHVVLHLY